MASTLWRNALMNALSSVSLSMIRKKPAPHPDERGGYRFFRKDRAQTVSVWRGRLAQYNTLMTPLFRFSMFAVNSPNDGPIWAVPGPGAGVPRKILSSSVEEADGAKFRSDAGQARGRSRRRQQSLDRVGDREGLPRGWRGDRADLAGRCAEKACRAARGRARRPSARPLRRHRALDHRRRVRCLEGKMGQDRLRGARDRLFRQGSARRALFGDHRGEFFQDHADQLLLADRDRAARRDASDRRRLDRDADLLRRREM